MKKYGKFITEPVYSKYWAPLVWLGDAVLCALIVLKVPYTEIDWVAYMEQVEQILVKDEYVYTQIRGSTGPLVYPAGHVRLFSVLYSLTDGGKDIIKAQYIFTGLYLLTLAIILTIYVRAKIPPYVLPFLVLSKRLHSIYLLRLFNDCFATFFALCAILVLSLSTTTSSRRPPLMYLSISAALLSLAVSVKMSAILYLPGAAIIYLSSLKSVWACIAGLGLPFIAPQVILALPFLLEDPEAYVSRAFEFSRQFLYKWTVNWAFLPEEIFLSRAFSSTLLIGHVSFLVYFGLFPGKRWLSFLKRSSPVQFLKSSFSISGITPLYRLNTQQIAQIIAMSNLIGILFARSLHYQFYCWFYWSIPLLLYTSSVPVLIKSLLWLAIESSWNIYPSTTLSSIIVVLSLLIIIVTNST